MYNPYNFEATIQSGMLLRKKTKPETLKVQLTETISLITLLAAGLIWLWI